MATSSLNLDPDELKRNLAITLGTQAPQLAAMRSAGPEMAAPGPIDLPGQPSRIPDLSIAPPAVKAPRGTIQGDQAERARMLKTGPGVNQIYGDVTGSSLGQAHPLLGKILGGLGEGIAKAGDIGLSAVAPVIAANLPGTTMHHNIEVGRANKQIGAEEGEQEKEAQTAEAQGRIPLEAAQTKKLQAEAEAEPALTEAEIAQKNAQATALLNPQAKTAFEAWQKQNPGKPVEEWLKAQAANKPTPRPDTPEQQYIDEYQKLHPGSTVAQAERQYATDTQKPPQQIMLVPGANGGYTAQNIRPGSTVAAGAMTPSGENSLYQPTGQEKTAAGRAQIVIKEIPNVVSMIDKQADKLGPIMGRWNDFMQGKVGMDNPDFAGFRQNLMMLATAVAMAHAVGRLPENLREEFDRAINAPQQNPANLKAVIKAVEPWMEDMANMAQPGFNQGVAPSQGAAPAKATHRWNPATGQIEEIK